MCENYVVFDCDIGTDDAWALIMLVKGESLSEKVLSNGPGKYKILGVTCVHGNTDVDNGTNNALRVLDSLDRNDIPVYKGCGVPILPRTWKRRRHFHGMDGFGDLQHEKDIDMSLIRQEHAVTAMYNIACKHPKQVDFLLLGPLTNFATCVNMYGDKFLDNIRNVYIMGGNFRGKGNITKSAEFNFMMDPEAAHIVLSRCLNTPITILPWETCIDGDFGITLKWRFEELGSNSSKEIQLMNYVESAILLPKGFVNWIVCDAILVAAYLFPHLAIASSRQYHVTVELTGTHTRGQMVLDHLRLTESNAKIITQIDKKHYKNIISWTGGLEELNIE
ncbi:inosine-uridine preferring nucleoside hydrolase-like [Teleopsis dalmanni]|uniref:inosine-uridine preferring nucleoside hydrolase-like n=1 Tax=Teleopsis dalmanni TaxID=139649 RepID=UPI0018CDCA4B|nr:inosine-uridine preferring nucleoside hydrolase-like [Teleopsis dalmanni]XP_037937928.1 inosine-uridine preferring nucleoside hydrolase-like [Teleopsis dalmanni]